MRPERQNQQVTLRVIQTVEDLPEEPIKSLPLRAINPVVPPEEMILWGIPEDPSKYEVQARLAHGLFGVTPTTLNNWEKDFLIPSQTIEKYYVRNEARRYKLAGVIELFVVQFRVSDHVVARVQDWDIALANGLVQGDAPDDHARTILKDASGRAILIPNRHPDEVEGWDEADLAKVKINPFKCGAEEHLRDLTDRWDKYQSEKASKALVVGTSAQPISSGLALNKASTVNPSGVVDGEIAELIEALAVLDEHVSHDPDELEQEIQESFETGFTQGVRIRAAHYKGRSTGVSHVDELANRKKTEPSS